MKNILSSLPNTVIIALLVFSCWTDGGGGVVHAASCADVQDGNPCSNGNNFRPDQLVVLRANPLEVDPDGKTCQQSLDEIEVDCDIDGNYVATNTTTSARMDILRLVSQQCCDDLLLGGAPPTCDEWNWDEPCGSGDSGLMLAKNEPLLWPLNGEDLSGRTCQQLLDEKKRETYIGPCGDGTDPNNNNNFATAADYQKIQLVIMELNLASCCRPPQADTTTTTGTSAEDPTQQQQEPGESSTTTTSSSTENNTTSGATSILSFSAFWRITAITAAVLVGSTVVGNI